MRSSPIRRWWGAGRTPSLIYLLHHVVEQYALDVEIKLRAEPCGTLAGGHALRVFGRDTVALFEGEARLIEAAVPEVGIFPGDVDLGGFLAAAGKRQGAFDGIELGIEAIAQIGKDKLLPIGEFLILVHRGGDSVGQIDATAARIVRDAS